MKGVTKIQNIWRKKQAEKEKNVRFNAAHQTSKVLFRIAFNGQQLTCVNYTKNGLLDMLKFQGKEEKVTVNLLEKAIPYNESDLSADVQRIISSATCLSEIPQLFNQDLAKKILKE
jgi:protoporphyrinogen oxidase